MNGVAVASPAPFHGGPTRPTGQQPALAYARSGQTPFFRLPLVEARPARPGYADYENLDAVLLGVPWDGGTTYQPGARLAPYHVRPASALLEGFHPSHGIDVFRRCHAADGGNVVFPPFDASAVRDAIRTEVGRVLDAGAVPILLGGDHSILLPSLRAVAERHGPVAVVHVDAHSDTSDASVWGEPFHHGTPLRHAIERGLVAQGRLHQIAIRASAEDEGEARFAQRHGGRVYSMEETADRGVDCVVADVRRRLAGSKVYLTFDIDAVDPAFAPGTGTPVPGGLSSREALRLLRGLAGIDLVGMDLVEVAPALDHADITAHLAAHLLYEGLALVALRRG